MKIITIGEVKPSKGQVMDPESMTEQAGYIPADQKIQSFLTAGMRLQLARAEQYDYDENYDGKEYMDETRRPNYDMADAFQDGLRVKARLKESERMAKEPKNDDKGSENPAPPAIPAVAPDGKA